MCMETFVAVRFAPFSLVFGTGFAFRRFPFLGKFAPPFRHSAPCSAGFVIPGGSRHLAALPGVIAKFFNDVHGRRPFYGNSANTNVFRKKKSPLGAWLSSPPRRGLNQRGY